MSNLMREADFIQLPLFVRGKVRDVYDLGDALLIVVTDRISAFDVVFQELIPEKGVVLNSISAFWFEQTRPIIGNHVISTDPAAYPAGLSRYANELAGRSMLVRKVKMLPAECIVRGYLEGSALKEYNKSGTIGGMPQPGGLRQADRLPEPVFTPSTKAESGHDQNINFSQLEELLGSELAGAVREKSLALYQYAAAYAEGRGIILADTKFEFGLLDGRLVVADELFTPDSSRFWDKSEYQPGRAQKSFDKQYLREWLETLAWDKNPPAPALPPEIIARTAAKYREAYSRLTGKDLA
ncbi:MAG: phosphoribosylaminoimidazolesuccinocarboxamide synthase [Clostridiaceae bacterium]|nr:phosphoribosylaminoimidazolesuccinocarboxamide synthase [Clostridiaceae bacterium]